MANPCCWLAASAAIALTAVATWFIMESMVLWHGGPIGDDGLPKPGGIGVPGVPMPMPWLMPMSPIANGVAVGVDVSWVG